MHQSQVGLPFISQTFARCPGGHDLERNRRSRQPIKGKPGFRLTALSERPFQRVPVS
jgi:hypothetical protein